MIEQAIAETMCELVQLQADEKEGLEMKYGEISQTGEVAKRLIS